LRFADSLAQKFGGKLILLYALEPVATPDFAYHPLMMEPEQAASSARLQLDKMCMEERVPESRIAETIVANGVAHAQITEAAKKLGVETVTLTARNASEMETAFQQLLSARAEALITASDPILLDRREQIASFALRHKVLAMGFVQQIAAAGALLSYGPSISWMYRQAGDYIGQILKGANPAEMPVLQPTHFELVINLKTANALGLTVPSTLLARADQVIE